LNFFCENMKKLSICNQLGILIPSYFKEELGYLLGRYLLNFSTGYYFVTQPKLNYTHDELTDFQLYSVPLILNIS